MRRLRKPSNGHRDRIIASCARFRVPALNSVLGATENGALMSYTFVWDELMRAPRRLYRPHPEGRLAAESPDSGAAPL